MRLRRLRARFCGLERVSERRHLLAVQLGHLGMQKRRRLVCRLELRLQFLPASVERLNLGLSLVNRDLVIEQQVQQFLDPRADPFDLALA